VVVYWVVVHTWLAGWLAGGMYAYDDI
jgi:hypothetical protein